MLVKLISWSNEHLGGSVQNNRDCENNYTREQGLEALAEKSKTIALLSEDTEKKVLFWVGLLKRFQQGKGTGQVKETE